MSKKTTHCNSRAHFLLKTGRGLFFRTDVSSSLERHRKRQNFIFIVKMGEMKERKMQLNSREYRFKVQSQPGVAFLIGVLGVWNFSK